MEIIEFRKIAEKLKGKCVVVMAYDGSFGEGIMDCKEASQDSCKLNKEYQLEGDMLKPIWTTTTAIENIKMIEEVPVEYFSLVCVVRKRVLVV